MEPTTPGQAPILRRERRQHHEVALAWLHGDRGGTSKEVHLNRGFATHHGCLVQTQVPQEAAEMADHFRTVTICALACMEGRRREGKRPHGPTCL